MNQFEDAIAQDPSFAPAYAGLAAAHAARYGTGEFQAKDEFARMHAAAEKALELDPLLAEAHGAIGMVYANQAQWERAEASFRRALELDPYDSVIYGNYALELLFPLGRVGEAVRQLRIALKHDPMATRLRYILVNALIANGRYDDAARECEALPADLRTRGQWLGRAWLGQGKVREAIAILEDEDKRGAAVRGYLGNAYGRAGRREEAEKVAVAAAADAYSQALTYAGMRDRDRTVGALERMAVLGPVRLGRNLTYPEFALVRGDARVKALRKRVGLPE